MAKITLSTPCSRLSGLEKKMEFFTEANYSEAEVEFDYAALNQIFNKMATEREISSPDEFDALADEIDGALIKLPNGQIVHDHRGTVEAIVKGVSWNGKILKTATVVGKSIPHAGGAHRYFGPRWLARIKHD